MVGGSQKIAPLTRTVWPLIQCPRNQLAKRAVHPRWETWLTDDRSLQLVLAWGL